MQIREMKNKSRSTRKLKVWVMMTRKKNQVMTIRMVMKMKRRNVERNFAASFFRRTGNPFWL